MNLGSSVSSNLSLLMAEMGKDYLSTAAVIPGSSSTTESTTATNTSDQQESEQQDRQRNFVGSVLHVPLNDVAPHRISPSRVGGCDGRVSPNASNISLPDLSVSPLTASSFHVMEREYNNDTWRMYNRIQAARRTTPSGSTSLKPSPSSPTTKTTSQNKNSLLPPFGLSNNVDEFGDDTYHVYPEEDDDQVFDMEL
mmetsp:Transcript_13460/g.19808  ORF Transcript_13460/g.19808 Transcript_13460/m.19808 type:complete len:196 (-) Transcript_13460:88-675(-)